MTDDLYPSQRLALGYLHVLVREAVNKAISMTGNDPNVGDLLLKWYERDVVPWEIDFELPDHPNADQLRMLIKRLEAIEYGTVQVRRMSGVRLSQMRTRMKSSDHVWYGMQLEKYDDEQTPTDGKFIVYLNAGTLSPTPLADRANPLLGYDSTTEPLPGDDD